MRKKIVAKKKVAKKKATKEKDPKLITDEEVRSRGLEIHKLIKSNFEFDSLSVIALFDYATFSMFEKFGKAALLPALKCVTDGYNRL